ncbi:hypothetical protein [Pseudomonas fluorescens]|uniref:Uncharacterized protein n=1 Tax=Pseudomonas fluorescens TaxID=294 RepID=A0A944DPK2_PSEFL|nr:hypothetical protein [Pseudomonas fluorescens]MBT2298345.1 hypothetical protein [Pseudomonas fluorescens]MBT2309531.1 hypothetical protein [Pseudomonas fluorescens]MBT2314695.1 hypothetical protein [Pseudomonas fluorescens]MBT2331883.1 hypothetical protein [Pseudomonas fluorescens]MBT2345348.1 hypothetical protein [Pseudomonas fluorescens]
MISNVEVFISKGGEKESCYLVCDSKELSITFCVAGGFDKTYTGSNFYKCFANLRRDNPDVIFFCKGAKINVHPSGMSAQMSLGLKAYELSMGVTPSLNDIVYIFEYDDSNLASDPSEQEVFFKEWVGSRLL